LVDRLELAHGGLEAVDVEVGHLAGVGLGEFAGAFAGLVEHLLDAGAILALEQRPEVPFGLEGFGVGEWVGSGRHGEVSAYPHPSGSNGRRIRHMVIGWPVASSR